MTDGEEKAMASCCLRKEKERIMGSHLLLLSHALLLDGHNGIEGLKLGRRETIE